MGFYQHLQKAFESKSKDLIKLRKDRLITWRKENVITRIDNPTQLTSARNLGYKAKQGYIVARVRLLRGGRKRPQIRAGRRSKHMRRKKIVGKSYQWIAEERAAKRYINCEVLNSYKVGKDAKYYWFEVILVDKEHPGIKNDRKISWIANRKNKRRVFRALTSSARKSRGLLGKGKGREKIRPSLRAHRKRGTN